MKATRSRRTVVATIASPETEAQLRNAQAQVLKSKRALAEAVATIAQRKSDLDFTKSDYGRAKYLVERGHVSQQNADLRLSKFQAAEAAYVAANAQRDQAEAAINAAQADVERYQAMLVDLVLSRPEVDACSTGSLAPVRWSLQGSAS
jgi:HlyD family secretion protein